MKVKVEFYKGSGKWYKSCEIELPNELVCTGKEAKDYILKNQTAVNIPDEFFMVVTDTCDSDPFFRRLYKPEELK